MRSSPNEARVRRLSFWLHAPMLPLLFLQGRRARARAPILPEAAGARRGAVDGGGARLSLGVLGESTAVGVGALEQEQALGFCLARALARARGLSVELQVVGRSGANVDEVRRAHLPRLEPPLDAVVVVVGVNDTLELTRGARWSSGLRALIADLRARGVREVVVSGVPPLGRLPLLPRPTRWAVGARAAYLDALLARACAEEGALHVPIRFPNLAELVAVDGFHPSAAGYAAWAEELASAWEPRART